MKAFLLTGILWMVILTGYGQVSLKGQLSDSLHKQVLQNATVSLTNVKDSLLVAFTRTDSAGNFSFNKLQPGKYRLSASHVNFHIKWKEVQVGHEPVDLGTIYMRDKSLLAEVNIVGQRPPVVINGDTLEFNTEAFKTKPNAVVEDMLKKMPGVDIDKDGTIRVNGKKINRLLVNGRDFFTGDPKLATRNLPADAIDKVQVFDKPSDQAAFTGIDDGNSEKTMNLKLKKDKQNATFGKAGAAGGTDARYDAQMNVNKFKGNQQVSVLGMANNTNKQGFSIMDVLNFTGQNRKMISGGGAITINMNGPDETGVPIQGSGNTQGVTNTLAGGINYNDLWNKKTDVNSSYFYNELTTRNNKDVVRQNITPQSSFTYLQNSVTYNNNAGNRFNLATDHKIDSFNSVKLTSAFGYQKVRESSITNYNSFADDGETLNEGYSINAGEKHGYNISNILLLKHKFRKKGRTLSVNGSMQYNDSRAENNQSSGLRLYNRGGGEDLLDQMNNIHSLTQGYGTNVNYTEPLSKRSLIELRGFYSINTGMLDKKTWDYNENSGKHDLQNDALSNAFTSRYEYAGGGISFRGVQKKYSYSFGANVQYSTLKSLMTGSDIRQQFTSVLPLGTFSYNFEKMKTLRVDYNTNLSQPTASQLQPVADVSDPLNIRIGNPALKTGYTHALNIQFFHAKPSTQSNFIAFANASLTNNAIVYSDKISSSGARISTPVNAKGVYNTFGMIEKGFRVKALKTRFSLGGNIAYNHSLNYVNEQENQMGNLTYGPRVSANYSYKEILDLSFIGRLNFSKATYSLQPVLNSNYLRQLYNAEATVNLPLSFSITNELTYTINSGRTLGYNQNSVMWNASVSKQVFKSKKGEIKMSGFNLLNRNTGVDRNTTANYIEDVSYRTLNRYFTLGFTYSLQKALQGGPKAVIRTF